MKLFGYVLIGLLVLVIGGALIAPGFVDWSQYKGEVETRVKAATGRQIHIDGLIKVSLLPTPALEVNDVRLSNAEGATSENMISLRSAVIRVALGPLLGGVVQVESVKLIEPVVEVELFKDGRTNLDFAVPASTNEAEESAARVASTSNEASVDPTQLPVQIDSFVIENGSLIYRDHKSGKTEYVSALNASIAAGSLIGPFDLSGSFVRSDLPLNFEISVGKIIHGRTVGFATNLNAGGQGKVNINGTLLNTEQGPKIKSAIKAEGENLAKLIGFITGGGTLPGFLGQSFTFAGDLNADKTEAILSEGTLSLGATNGAVAAKANYTKDVEASLKLTLKHADLNKWMALPEVKTEAAKLPERIASIDTSTGRPRATMTLSPQETKPKTAEKAPFTLPKNITLSAEVTAETLVFMDDAIRNLNLSASLAGGEVTLNQFSAALPGGSDAAMFGFFTTAEGQPQFEGNLEGRVTDLRGALRWLRVKIPAIPADRLRTLGVKSAIKLSGDQLQLVDLKATLDSSKINGGVAIALRQRPAFGANFVVDRLNLDAYRPDSDSPAKVEADNPSKADATADGGDKKAASTGTPPANSPNPFTALAALAAFDANLKFKINALTAQGQPAKNARLDATLYKGVLTLRDVGVDNLAGASLQIKGELSKLDSVPVAKGLLASASIQDLPGFLKLINAQVPLDTRNLGPVLVSANLDGSLLSPKVDGLVNGAGGQLSISGKVSPLDFLTGFKLRATAKHRDLAALTHRLALSYRPSGKSVGVDLSADVAGDASKIAISNLSGNLAGATVDGDIQANLSGAKPYITAKLNLGDLRTDLFVPSSSKGESQGSSGKGSSAKSPPTAANSNKERWSKEPLDLSVLSSLDADLAIQAKSLSFEKFRLDNADIAVTLKNGVLTTNRLIGKLFNGDLNGKTILTTQGQTSFKAAISLANANVAAATKAATGKEAATGVIGFSSEVQTSGNSVHALVSALNGNGKFALNKVDVKSGNAKGSSMAGALDLIKALNGLGGAFGGKSGPGLADVTGSYTILKGVARSDDLNLVSNITKGQAKGSVDLPNWMVDVRGNVQMAQNFLTSLLASRVKIPENVPFTVLGPLDSPSVKLLTGSSASGQAQPAQNPVGSILEQFIPKKGSSQEQEQKNEKIRPEDIFKQLLKGGIR